MTCFHLDKRAIGLQLALDVQDALDLTFSSKVFCRDSSKTLLISIDSSLLHMELSYLSMVDWNTLLIHLGSSYKFVDLELDVDREPKLSALMEDTVYGLGLDY